MGMGKGSTNQLELSRGTIQNMEILIPVKEIRTKFEVFTQLIHAQIDVINTEMEHLQNARDHLLPMLMSAKLEE